MTKDDLRAIEDLAELAFGDNPGAASIELERRLRLVPAIIARQLTIRNEQERHHAKRLHGIFEAIVEIADKPAPDALVEVVEEAIFNVTKHGTTNLNDSVRRWLKKAEDALAAHEKAVT